MGYRPHISLYWKCQLIGWTIASLYWTFLGVMGGGFLWGYGLVQLISDIILYIAITHFYKIFAERNRWQDLSLNRLIVRMLFAIPVMGMLYTIVTVLKLYFFRTMFLNPGAGNLEAFVSMNALAIFIAGVRLMAIWLLAYHLYHYAKREIYLAAENVRLEVSFKQAQLDNLTGQLNPHFLFNTLNTIKSLIYTRPDGAGRGIDLLSELLRNSLYVGDTMMIRLSEEIGLVRDYLELESLRLEERLHFEFDLDVSLSGTMIPRLSMQTLVENAVKHGIAKELNGGAIRITTLDQEGFLCIRVLSSGILENDKNVSGIGLDNLRKRLEIGYKGRAGFKIEQQGAEVAAEIKIPMQ